MAVDYYQLSEADKLAFLNGKTSNQDYRFVGHSFSKNQAGKQYCSRCGLFALNNKASQWCVDKGCQYEDHPQYKSRMKKLAGIKLNVI